MPSTEEVIEDVSNRIDEVETLIHDHPVLKHMDDDRTFGERAADAVVKRIGTWGFLIAQAVIIVVWVIGNVYALRHVGTKSFDPYPFILLNLMLSIQAAVTGPLLLLAGNRQQQKDRELATNDFEVNEKALDLLMQTQDLLGDTHDVVADLHELVGDLHTGKAPPVVAKKKTKS